MPERGTDGTRPPLIVIEGDPASVAREADRLGTAGYRMVSGFRGSRPVRGEVRAGVVSDAESAGHALLAALGGAGVLVEASADRLTLDRLVDDLRRIGAVDHRIASTDDGQSAEPRAPRDARAILGLLAEGHSLGEAASILGISRRTADRRLGDARRALGVTRTTEAIARASRLGWLRQDR